MSGDTKLSDEEYEQLLKPLARELSAMSRWVSETGQRMVIVFEGRDTAGKGGSIEMFSRVLNPRQCRVAALPSPDERERTEWYFQRYVAHLPARRDAHRFRAVDFSRLQRPAGGSIDVAARPARPGARCRIALGGHRLAAARSRGAERALRRAAADPELSGRRAKA